MLLYRRIRSAVIGIFLEKEKAPLQQEDPTLLCASNLTTKEVRFSVAQYLCHSKYPNNKQSAKLILNLLLISRNVELNSGPTNIKYPCREKCKRSDIWAIYCLRSV